MRKFGIKFATHHPRADEVKRDFIACTTTEDWRRTLDRWYGVDGGAAAGG
jgi:hypothetical protein